MTTNHEKAVDVLRGIRARLGKLASVELLDPLLDPHEITRLIAGVDLTLSYLMKRPRQKAAGGRKRSRAK